MVICEALQISPEELLVGKVNDRNIEYDHSIALGDIEIQIMNFQMILLDQNTPGPKRNSCKGEG